MCAGNYVKPGIKSRIQSKKHPRPKTKQTKLKNTKNKSKKPKDKMKRLKGDRSTLKISNGHVCRWCRADPMWNQV